MKNNIKNLLRGGVMMLAAVFAFAFTQPKTDANQVRFVPIVDGSGLIVGGTPVQAGYTCDSAPTEVCTALFLNDDPKEENLIEESIEQGLYQPPM
ncbi:hypothetical protein [Belliella aquatica]|uniref:Secreted protein n=1 Tax=Belliella aquatica TaxID=1323734 RepID=A0ABQ1M1Z6_9BACT|nr:hypothetical protein [Belliella aquatica]MCH7406835.1 hypothetical protein [Belliella aquatica]GGC32346.1 hypothetical protein GCM10010993_09160 [Belliella aquatica]